MTNPELAQASAMFTNNNTTITTSTITAQATTPATISSPNPTFLVSPPSSCCSFSSRQDQEYFTYAYPSTKSIRTQEDQDNDMDIISTLGITEQPSYNFFGDSSKNDGAVSPSLSRTGSTHQPLEQQQHNIQVLLTNQDSTSVNICSSKSSSCHQGDYETHVSSTTVMRSDFRGHPSSQRALSYELKGSDLYRLQDEGDSDSCWEEHTLRLETESMLDEELEQLSPIPFSDLPSLTNIGLCSLGIVKLSSNIRFLASATCVQILPETINQLSKLVDLKLSFNQLECLPAGIGGLTKLGALYLDNNKLESIPSQIGQIKGLVNLDLSDNPITVLPAEVGKLQFLRRLKLDRCPLVEEFSHSPLQSPPSLLELAARVIVRQNLAIPSKIVPHLKEYIQSAESCSFCEGPFFDSFVKRGKMIEKNDMLIPLEYTLCQPHWNTEQERIKLLFCKRPITAPPLQLPKSSIKQNGSSSSSSKGGDASVSTQSSSSSSSSPSPSSSSGLLTPGSGAAGATTINLSRRPSNRKYATDNGVRERPLANLGNRLSFLRSNSSSNASSSTSSSTSSSSRGSSSRPTSTYRQASLPVMTSTSSSTSSSRSSAASNTRTAVPSPLSSESISTLVSGNINNNNNNTNLIELDTEQNNNINNNISINNNAVRPTPRRSLTVGILARAASKLKRPLSIARNSEPATVVATTMGSTPSLSSTSSSPAEPTSTE
ncbi:hypothetical protein BGZ76_009541 [Entomortierella beljakovae]|nr:hypothetical protein BGZ76_009541 [Entomortierella beljakovae]